MTSSKTIIVHLFWGSRRLRRLPIRVLMWGAAPRVRRISLFAALVGTLLAPAAAQAAPPAITNVSPMSGSVGSTVTITGSDFTGVDLVSFYDYPTTYTVVSSTRITATVPAGTPSPGRWRVRTAEGLAVYDSLFTVTNAAPTINSVSPMSGQAGSTVTITGTSFTGADLVSFYDIPTSYTVVSPTQITATVPAGTPSSGRWPCSQQRRHRRLQPEVHRHEHSADDQRRQPDEWPGGLDGDYHGHQLHRRGPRLVLRLPRELHGRLPDPNSRERSFGHAFARSLACPNGRVARRSTTHASPSGRTSRPRWRRRGSSRVGRRRHRSRSPGRHRTDNVGVSVIRPISERVVGRERVGDDVHVLGSGVWDELHACGRCVRRRRQSFVHGLDHIGDRHVRDGYDAAKRPTRTLRRVDDPNERDAELERVDGQRRGRRLPDVPRQLPPHDDAESYVHLHRPHVRDALQPRASRPYDAAGNTSYRPAGRQRWSATNACSRWYAGTDRAVEPRRGDQRADLDHAFVECVDGQRRRDRLRPVPETGR